MTDIEEVFRQALEKYKAGFLLTLRSKAPNTPPPELHLRLNNTSAWDKCPVCGEAHNDADVPVWLFLRGAGYAAVCDQCCKKHAPRLLSEAMWLNSEYARQTCGDSGTDQDDEPF